MKDFKTIFKWIVFVPIILPLIILWYFIDTILSAFKKNKEKSVTEEYAEFYNELMKTKEGRENLRKMNAEYHDIDITQ